MKFVMIRVHEEAYIKNNSKLTKLKFIPLPLGSIHTDGWLLNQLHIQANGLSGHLDEFWPDISESGWIGGKAEGWERGPYWLDGIIPLAFLLDDDKLKRKVTKWVDYILNHQHKDGWLGPVKNNKGIEYDPWPVFLVLKAMIQYQEVTKDKRIIPAMDKFFRKLNILLEDKTFWNGKISMLEWGRHRCAELILSIYWLYEQTNEKWLLSLSNKVHAKGYDWSKNFNKFKYKNKTKKESFNMITHVVNNAMAIKYPGVWYRQSHAKKDKNSVYKILETLDTYHGQITGVFTGDEHLAGKNPSQGTELCSVVEYMFSLEILASILGDVSLLDRLERIAFNALPATFSPDMWAHQYDQQVNQVICKVAEDRIYTTNGPDSNIYGLEPHYGCCTANMHQGWPKYASHLWMKTQDSGLAVVAYAPSKVVTKIKNNPVKVDLKTDYPFDETLHFKITVKQPVKFPLYLRIPAWTKKATIKVNKENSISVASGKFYCIDRKWSKTTSITLHLPMEFKTQRRYNNSISVERGPLIYSLKIGENWKLIKGKLPHGDWEVHPTTPWNYALNINIDDMEKSMQLEKKSIGDCPFSPKGAPVAIKILGSRIPEWTLEHNAAGSIPKSPANSSKPLEELMLIPYGCTNLRVTEFPTLE
ncbi:MAG: glycoside hydrolase family 127 protein [Elusimicrobia bacterium]|nr:glycoside hydrolase family 127 protein [Elusimicrobiota bacterium]